MHLIENAEQYTTALANKRPLHVISFGHEYKAWPVEFKGARVRLEWTNKGGRVWRMWATVPGKTLEETNPDMKLVRDLRTEATSKDKRQAGWRTRDRDRAQEAANRAWVALNGGVEGLEAYLRESFKFWFVDADKPDTYMRARMEEKGYTTVRDYVLGEFVKTSIAEYAYKQMRMNERNVEIANAEILALEIEAYDLRVLADCVEGAA
jgi:hypothetical protein